MEPFEQQEIRQDFTRLGWALIASQLLLMFLSFAGSLLCSQLLWLFSPLRGTWLLLQGYITIFAVLCSMLPMLSLGLGNRRLDGMLARGEKIWPVQVIFCFLMVLGLQLLVTVVCAPLVDLLEQLGFSFGAAGEAATSFADSASLLFYSITVAPICEELVYRGALLRYLEPYGRWFAIFMSALVFALMHGNAVQMPIALVIGLVFGYLALRYSLRLTILLHILNNLFVELIGRIASVNGTLGGAVNAAFMIAGLVSLALMAMSSGRALWRDLRAEKPSREVLRCFFTTLPIAAIFLYMVTLTVSSIVG